MDTIRLTTAQAIVEWMIAQRSATNPASGNQQVQTQEPTVPMFPGVFAIFGHGNVTCLGHALEEHQEELPTWRGQNEQGMALAAIAYNKAVRGRQIMTATSSIGPGATNMVTAAGVAMANRLPLLLLSGDTFVSRIPDPVLQQTESPSQPSTTVNDAFRPVTAFWDRIVHPAQIIQSLPSALSIMLDPATRGPAFLGLPQDVQATAYDYPVRFFEPVTHHVPRPRADQRELAQAASILSQAQQPLIIAGGGVHYSGAQSELASFADHHRIPVVETMAGKSSLLGDNPNYVGPIGVTGCEAANGLAAEADVILALGTRLQDFTTGSWTVFTNESTRIIAINTTRFDSTKHQSLPVVGDIAVALPELSTGLKGWVAPNSWMAQATNSKSRYQQYIAKIGTPSKGPITYAQVVRVVNDLATPADICLAAAGGFPGEVNNGWWSKGIGTFDCEYGFSCMGYEISGGWGAAMALDSKNDSQESGDVFVFVGDGSYLMMNSDLYSSVLSGHKMIVIVCDNGGFAVINRLQINQGGLPFNNLLSDTRHVGEPARVNFAAHAQALGCHAEKVTTLDGLADAVDRARLADRTTVITLQVDPDSWTEGGASWQVGVPETSNRPEVLEARDNMTVSLANQRIGW